MPMPDSRITCGCEAKPKVKDVIAEANKALGASIAIARFARLKAGEAVSV